MPKPETARFFKFVDLDEHSRQGLYYIVDLNIIPAG